MFQSDVAEGGKKRKKDGGWTEKGWQTLACLVLFGFSYCWSWQCQLSSYYFGCILSVAQQKALCVGRGSVPGDCRHALDSELALPFPSALLTSAIKLCCVFACSHQVTRIIVVGSVGMLVCSVLSMCGTLQKCFVTHCFGFQVGFQLILGCRSRPSV